MEKRNVYNRQIPDKVYTGQSPGHKTGESGLIIPVKEVPFKKVAVRDLPLHIVITNIVMTAGLPKKEFLSDVEFEEYLNRYAVENIQDPAKREKFIKKQTNNALFLDDEIAGDFAYQLNGRVDFKNARKCGFGILKTQSREFYMFQTAMGMDLPTQLAAYQALTFGCISEKDLHRFTTAGGREHLKMVLGEDVYNDVLKALKIPQMASD
ncbi:MAG: hypothetical protein ACOY30_08270 [Bacillota bacterium]